MVPLLGKRDRVFRADLVKVNSNRCEHTRQRAEGYRRQKGFYKRIFGFFAFMYIPSAKIAHGSEIIVALFTVSFVYIASYVVFAIVRSLKNRKKKKRKNM